ARGARGGPGRSEPGRGGRGAPAGDPDGHRGAGRHRASDRGPRGAGRDGAGVLPRGGRSRGARGVRRAPRERGQTRLLGRSAETRVARTCCSSPRTGDPRLPRIGPLVEPAGDENERWVTSVGLFGALGRETKGAISSINYDVRHSKRFRRLGVLAVATVAGGVMATGMMVRTPVPEMIGMGTGQERSDVTDGWSGVGADPQSQDAETSAAPGSNAPVGGASQASGAYAEETPVQGPTSTGAAKSDSRGG